MNPFSNGLPATAKAKLAQIEDASEQALMLANATTRRIGELHKTEAYARAVEGENEMPTEVMEEISRLQDIQARQQNQYREKSGLHGMLRNWFAAIPASAELKEAKPPRVRLQKGETIALAISRVRTDITRLLGERMKVAQAPLPLQDQKVLAKRFVEKQAAFARPSISVGGDNFSVTLGDSTFNKQPDAFALCCFLDQERMIARLEEELERKQPKGAFTLSAADKPIRLEEIATSLLDLERLEEALIEMSEANGQSIARRLEASAEAILGIVIVTAVKKVAA